MPGRNVASYGCWKSPVTGELAARGSVWLGAPHLSGQDVYWSETRPAEGGRYVVVRRRADGSIEDVTPAGFNARTRVHEYGGGAYFVGEGVVFFSNFEDQRLYRQEIGSDPVAITPEPRAPAAARYADGRLSSDGSLAICVRELHRDSEVVNEIVTIPPDGSSDPVPIVAGNDFYSYPRLSPDGKTLAWTTWNHPNMPWDGTELWVGDFRPGGDLANTRKIAGSERESIFQPGWGSDGTLYFASDRTGWWNLYRWSNDSLEIVCEDDTEFGAPQWIFDQSTHSVLGDGRLVCIYGIGPEGKVAVIEDGKARDLGVPYPAAPARWIRASGTTIVYVGGDALDGSAIVAYDVDSGEAEILRRGEQEHLEPGYVSAPETIQFATDDGKTAFAHVYRPANKDWEAPEDERPPLLLTCHGGPTGGASTALDYEIQFWTSRGFLVADVDYGGSTGYGREYRERLRGRWGVVDLADCVNAARHLARSGVVDDSRLVIRGGSAGGYTTLCALCFSDVFAAGANYYGVADLETFVGDTHKFESRYLDSLLGPWPETAETYRQRSPIHFVERFSAPLITFQGEEDEIVPPSQSELIVDAVRKRGVPCAYLTFAGEQHGFRKAESIKRSLEAELYFYGRVFGFEPADEIEPVIIDNL